jgi:peptide/nickel transport system ATP-binding protein
MKDLLRVENLTIEFAVHDGVLRAVDDVSFSLPPGGTLALVGESGSGKSVCSQAIMGLLPRNATIPSGKILFDDPRTDGPPVDIARLDRTGEQMRHIRGGRISLIFQEPMTSLSSLHTVGDQIGEAVELHGGGRGMSELQTVGRQIGEAVDQLGRRVGRAEAEELTKDMLRLVGFPDPRRALRTYPFELSGGLRQRAMIAMALVCRPALLIADEPTTALDVTIQAQILQLMKNLQKELGMALLMITHDLGVVANVADDVVVMYRGKVVESGDLHDMYRDPQHPYLKALLKAVPRFDMAPGERLVPIRDIKAATGHLLKEKPQSAPTTTFNPNAPVLKVRHLSKTYRVRKAETLLEQLMGGGTTRSVRAVNDVSFDVMRGECLGLVGESGCGKTTLSKILMRAITPNDPGDDEEASRIVFDDWGRKTDVLALKGEGLDRFRTKLQFIFQDPFGSLNPRMTVYDILVEPLIIHGIGDTAYRHEMVAELMEMVGLDRRHLNRYPHSFSGGQRQRIGIARALALRPDMVICDEPVSALDVSIQAQILNLLKDLQKQLGLTYMFISHNLAVVSYIADRIAVMCAGRLVELAPAAELFRNPLHPYTKALLSAVPMPDPDARLDLGALMEGKASNPANWPTPFTDDGAATLNWVEAEPEHYVRIVREGR